MSVDPFAGITVQLQWMTPQQAAELLARSECPQQRDRSPKVIAGYMQDMISEDWPVGPGMVCIAQDGTLLNGYHRLEACVKSEKAFPTIVVYGLTPAAQDYMDTHKPRLLRDTLKAHGETFFGQLAPAINLGVRWDKGQLSMGRVASTRHEQLAWLDIHPSVRDYIGTRPTKRAPRLGLSSAALDLFEYQASRIDAQGARDCLLALLTGAPNIQPMIGLRKQIVRLNAKDELPTDQVTQLAWVVKAWNRHIQGRPGHAYTWYKKHESFPDLLGLNRRPFDVKEPE